MLYDWNWFTLVAIRLAFSCPRMTWAAKAQAKSGNVESTSKRLVVSTMAASSIGVVVELTQLEVFWEFVFARLAYRRILRNIRAPQAYCLWRNVEAWLSNFVHTWLVEMSKCGLRITSLERIQIFAFASSSERVRVYRSSVQTLFDIWSWVRRLLFGVGVVLFW